MDAETELQQLRIDRDFWKRAHDAQREAHQRTWDMLEQSFDLYVWLRQHILWSMETFGDGARTEGLCKHIEKELEEIRQQPNDIMEWIDVIILACDGAWRAGYSAKEICLALQQKQNLIETRQYPKTPEDMPSEHIKTIDNQ